MNTIVPILLGLLNATLVIILFYQIKLLILTLKIRKAYKYGKRKTDISSL